MQKQKLLYLSPRTGTLVVQPEGVICESEPTATLDGGASFGGNSAVIVDGETTIFW